MTPSKDAFLSHNKADKDWVRRLGTRIEAETLDPHGVGRCLSVFFDEWDIETGENVVNKLGAGLADARFTIVVMSPEFFKSGWTNLEWTDVVAGDPGATKQHLIPILLRDVSLDGKERIVFPAPFKSIKYFDFREKRRFESEFSKLLRRLRGLPAERGEKIKGRVAGTVPVLATENSNAWQPDSVSDLLLSNAFQVTHIPSVLYGGKTVYSESIEVWKAVETAEDHLLREGRIWTFSNLQDSNVALSGAVDKSNILKENSRDWLLSPIKRQWLITLLNKSLSSHLYHLAIKRDDRGRYFFRPNRDGSSRIWKTPGSRDREVATKKIVPDSNDSFWVHHAAYIKFRQLGDRLFIVVEPTYLFTTDGNSPFDGRKMGRMVMMWGGRERNPSVLRNLLFWGRIISKGCDQVEIHTGGESILASSIPASALMNVGIEGDSIRIKALVDSVEKDLDDAAKATEFVADPDAIEESEEVET